MIELSRELWAQMVSEAIAAFPLEGCGLLLGHEPSQGFGGSIEQFVPIENAAASHTEYRLDPAQYANAATKATIDGLAIVGIMHSHPSTTAVPSSVDIEQANHQLIPKEWHWVIVSLLAGQPEVRSYLIVNGIAIGESLHVC